MDPLANELNRLASIKDPALQLTELGYDDLDNLLSVTDPRALVTSYGYDAAGNTTSDGTRTFTYTDAGRLKTAAGTTYSYNGLGERVKKTSSTSTTYFAYDEAGHLIGEYDASGDLVEETPDGLMGRGGMPSAPGAVSPVYGLRFGGGGASAPESLPQGVVDASADFGDALSVGATVGVREAMGTNDVVNFCSNEYWGGVAAGVAVHVVGFRSGGELNLGRNWRFAPWGNRTANPYGRWPHYHRRGAPDSTGTTPPGQGIGRHRPLEPSRHDRQWWDRF